MTESVKERVKRHEKEYPLWYDAVFLARQKKCNHLHCGTLFRCINGTAWQKIDNFEAYRDICTKCGETVQIWLRNEKGLRKLLKL